MRELIEDLKHIKLAIFDLDGVIYRGRELIPNADDVIQSLKNLSIQVIYNSNNSTITRQMYVEKLNNLGIPSEFSDFYTSASITASEITRIKKNANIFVIGEIGIREELKAKGHTIVNNPKNYSVIDFVIVGLDRDFKYETLGIAQQCILKGGAHFYATNADSTLPMEDGLMPGAGTMVKSLEECTNQKPIKVFGKPEPFGIQLILDDYNISPTDACIFGDRLNTDIAAGNRAGIMTICVLTGVTTREMIDDLKKSSNEYETFDKSFIPDLVINTLNDIFK